MKRLMITKTPVVKIKKLVVNHESRPLRSNPEVNNLKLSSIV